MARERWLADGWEITEGTVRDWAYRSGTDSPSPLVGANALVPNRDGEVWQPKATGPGSFTLDVWLAGANRTEVEASWRLLLRAVRRRHKLVRWTRYMASGEVVQCDAELVGTIDPTHIAQRGMRASMTFNVPSGRWHSQNTYTMQTSAGSGLPQVLTLTNLEPSTEAMIDLTYQVKGAITAPIIVDTTDGVDGDQFKYDAAVGSGHTLTVNAEAWTITGAGGLTINQSKVYPSGRRLMTVVAARPGQTPKVELRGSGASGATQLIVTGKRSYAC